MAWDGRFETSHYNTNDLIADLINCINYGVISAKALPNGGVEVLEDRGNGVTRMNVYFPKGNGTHAHYWVDSEGNTYARR